MAITLLSLWFLLHKVLYGGYYVGLVMVISLKSSSMFWTWNGLKKECLILYLKSLIYLDILFLESYVMIIYM